MAVGLLPVRRKVNLNITGKLAPFPLAKFRKYLKRLTIHSKDYGSIPFEMIGTQKYILGEIVSGIKDGISQFVVLKGRQQGATTLFVAIDFFYALEHPGLLGTFILHEEKALNKWRALIDMQIAMMPRYIEENGKRYPFRPTIDQHNRNLLLFGNKSSFSYLIGGVAENAGGGLGRSLAANYVHGTEVAMYANEDDLKAFAASLSSIYPYRLQIWESTAKGFNHFYERVQAAKDSDTVKFIFSGWWRDERNQFHVRDPRFKLFAPNNRLSLVERERVRNVRVQYDFEISMQQIAWYRYMMRDQFQDDQSVMDEEYPFTEEDAFQASGSKYFTTPVLTQLTRDTYRRPFQTYKYRMTRRWEDIDVYNVTDLRAELRVWEHASRFGYYIVSCDPAYGSSDQADNNVIQVWRAFAESMVQVAEFCTNETASYQTAWVCCHLAGFYGRKDSRLILEMNGVGKAVFEEIRRVQAHLRDMPITTGNFELRRCLENMRDFFYQRIDTMNGELAYGIVTTDDLKRFLMADFKSAVELGRVDIRSKPLVEEMRRLVSKEGSVAAEGGFNDDRVMAGAMAHHCWSKWVQPMLIGLRMTRARAMEIDANGGENTVDQLLTNFLKRSNILVDFGQHLKEHKS